MKPNTGVSVDVTMPVQAVAHSNYATAQEATGASTRHVPCNGTMATVPLVGNLQNCITANIMYPRNQHFHMLW